MSEFSRSVRGNSHNDVMCSCCIPKPRCCHSSHDIMCDVLSTRCPSVASYSELQSLCNSLRSGYVSRTCSPIEDHSGCYLHSPHESLCHHQPSVSCLEEDIGQEWFDEEAMGYDAPLFKFDFPVPSEPVLPTNQLNIMTLGSTEFFVDNDGYVQVHTYGECYQPFVEASIGVWFGPNHPNNKSELVHRGRRTAEAAHFVAIIEAIRAAGSCGVTKLQINTEYENAVKFMIYFIFKWENNGWKTVLGTPVKNQVLIRELDYYSRFLEVKWNVVRDDDSEGLIEACKLANEALTRSEKAGGIDHSRSTVRTVDAATFAEERCGMMNPSSAQPASLGRENGSNIIRTFLPCGLDDTERQAARRRRFAPY